MKWCDNQMENQLWTLRDAPWDPKTGPTPQELYLQIIQLNYKECQVFETELGCLNSEKRHNATFKQLKRGKRNFLLVA